MDSQEPSRDWLQRFISAALRRNLCTRIGCTTCGAGEFRSGLMARLGVSISEEIGVPVPPLGADRAERLLDLMSELKPPEHDMSLYFEPMQLMISECRCALGREALPAMQDRLGQSWAGGVLRSMIADVQALVRARQAREEARMRGWEAHAATRTDPAVSERRLLRERERRLAQERRLLRKKERDKLLWVHDLNELGKEGDTPTPAYQRTAPPPSAYQQRAPHSPPPPPPNPQTWPLGIQPNRFAGFCYCCGNEVGTNAGVIFKPIVHNANAPGDWKYACLPCNGSAHVGTYAAQR